MNEFLRFQERLDEIKLIKAGRDTENIGVIDLTTMRDMYNDLLSDIESYVSECRRDEDSYTIDDLLEIGQAGLKLKTEIKNDRVDIITERLVKEERIKALERERKQLLKNEETLSGYSFSDSENLSGLDKVARDLQLNIEERKREIEREIYELNHGSVLKLNVETKTETKRGGLHLSKEDREELEREENSASIDGVSFTDEENKSSDSPEMEEELLETPVGLTEELESAPGPLEKDENLETVPEPIKEETLEVPMELEDEEELEVPEELSLEEPVLTDEEKEEALEVPAPLGETPVASEPLEEKLEEVPDSIHDEEDEKAVEVTNIVQPKPTLWQKIGIALGSAIAFLSAATAVHTGIMARSLNNIAEVEEGINNDEEEPSEEEKRGENNANIIVDGGESNTPSESSDKTEIDDKMEIKLAPGESVYDESTGIEVTADGSAYQHTDNGTTNLEARKLDKDDKGYAVVMGSDLKDTTPAATPAPAPEPTPEPKKTADEYIQEQTQLGNTENVAAAQQALADTPDDLWRELFGDGPSM